MQLAAPESVGPARAYCIFAEISVLPTIEYRKPRLSIWNAICFRRLIRLRQFIAPPADDLSTKVRQCGYWIGHSRNLHVPGKRERGHLAQCYI